jgi:3-hydroxymyristoyl/3-hydroxydecanoyl-(acyl carrier protein) dehydratase
MNGHFSAFSFVDRITRFESGIRVEGNYLIPATVEEFPGSLVAEAVGQLAAWSAMEAVGFSHRPVAGIAGEIHLLARSQPGQTLRLTAELESVDTETVAYSGSAFINGCPVLRLVDSLGPMVPIGHFDAPEALRQRLELLRGPGAHPGLFPGLPPLPVVAQNACAENRVCATLKVPAEASLFADHFPRRPVFPGTLLMHSNLRTASMLVERIARESSVAWQPARIANVKLRDFISPGQEVRLEAKLEEESSLSLVVGVASKVNDRLVGSAEVHYAAEGAV